MKTFGVLFGFYPMTIHAYLELCIVNKNIYVAIHTA